MEKIEPETTVIFSGRFDPPHLGHVLTILKLCERFGRVIVPVLNYKEREFCNVLEAKSIFDGFFDIISPVNSISSRPEIVINSVHFGEVTKEYYENLLKLYKVLPERCVYMSGNEFVLEHITKLGFRTERAARSMDHIYEGTKIRKYFELEN